MKKGSWDFVAYSAALENFAVAIHNRLLDPQALKEKLCSLLNELPQQWQSHVQQIAKSSERLSLGAVLDALAIDITHSSDEIQRDCYRMLRTMTIALFTFENIARRDARPEKD